MGADMTVANTILQQLGGANKVAAMTGADAFLSASDSLTFNFRGNRKMSKCRITLKPDDTYRMEFFRLRERGLYCDTVYKFEFVYAEDLIPVFERTTGLYLSI